MWNFLLSFFIGGAIGASRFGRFVRMALNVCAVGVLIAGLIYAYVFLNAVRERSQDHHVHAHSSR